MLGAIIFMFLIIGFFTLIRYNDYKFWKTYNPNGTYEEYEEQRAEENDGPQMG